MTDFHSIPSSADDGTLRGFLAGKFFDSLSLLQKMQQALSLFVSNTFSPAPGQIRPHQVSQQNPQRDQGDPDGPPPEITAQHGGNDPP